MAVLKHIAIKNADYSAAVCYLKYQHDERHLKPLLDENGSMMLRSEFHMNGVNCNPDTFDLECEMLNDQYRKTTDTMKSSPITISSVLIRAIKTNTILLARKHKPWGLNL